MGTRRRRARRRLRVRDGRATSPTGRARVPRRSAALEKSYVPPQVTSAPAATHVGTRPTAGACQPPGRPTLTSRTRGSRRGPSRRENPRTRGHGGSDVRRRHDARPIEDAAPSKRLLTAADVAERLAISRSGAYALIARLPGVVHIGRAARVPETVIDDYVRRGGDRAWPAVEISATTASAGAAPLSAGASTTSAAKTLAAARTRRTEHWRAQLRALFRDDASTRSRRPRG